MNFPPFRSGRPQGPPPRGPQPRAPQPTYDGRGPGPARAGREQQAPTAIIPSNVLRALISQSRKRCASYVEMMQKFGQGLGQLDLESQQMVRGRERDPIVMGQLREYFDTVRELAELNEQKVAQIIQQEVQFQQVLQTWLYGRPLESRRPGPAIQSHQGPALRNAPPGAMGPRGASREPGAALAPPEEDVVMMPPAGALSGYAAHALDKTRAAMQAQERAAARRPQAQAPAQAPVPAPVPPRSEPKVDKQEAPAPKLAEKTNGPSTHSIVESKAEPEAALPAPEGEGS